MHHSANLAWEDVPWFNTSSQVKQHDIWENRECVCLISHLQGLTCFSCWLLSKPRAGSLPSTCRSQLALQQNLCLTTAVSSSFPKCSSSFRLTAYGRGSLSHRGASEILNPLWLLREKLIANDGNSPIWILFGFPLPRTEEIVANLH